MPLNTLISKNLRRLMANHGHSHNLQSLSHLIFEKTKVHVDPTTIGRILNKEVTPTLDTLSRIAEALDQDLREFFRPDNDK